MPGASQTPLHTFRAKPFLPAQPVLPTGLACSRTLRLRLIQPSFRHSYSATPYFGIMLTPLLAAKLQLVANRLAP